jgi:hypothetical protein
MIMIYRKKWITFASILMLGCSGRPTVEQEYNVLLNLLPPDDPLYDTVYAANLSIDAADMQSPFLAEYAIEPADRAPLIIGLNLESGPARIFRVGLKSDDGRVLFSASAVEDISDGQMLILDFVFRQSGFGRASIVKIFRDQLPWDSRALDSTLYEQGLTQGHGLNQFYVYYSDMMATVELHPGMDLVIISNDQPQTFYDNYALNQDRFEEFVRQGGTLLWCACDLGWNYGSMTEAGLSLPGPIGVVYSLGQTNIVANSEYQLLLGLEDTLSGNYASQEYFQDLPYGALTYLTDTDGHPTLAGYGLGNGWVLVSGQPLEYNYDRRDVYNIGDLLPRLLRFLLGIAEGGTFSLFPGSGAYENEYGDLTNSPAFVLEGTPRQ